MTQVDTTTPKGAPARVVVLDEDDCMLLHWALSAIKQEPGQTAVEASLIERWEKATECEL